MAERLEKAELFAFVRRLLASLAKKKPDDEDDTRQHDSISYSPMKLASRRGAGLAARARSKVIPQQRPRCLVLQEQGEGGGQQRGISSSAFRLRQQVWTTCAFTSQSRHFTGSSGSTKGKNPLGEILPVEVCVIFVVET